MIIIFTNSGNYIKKYQLVAGNVDKNIFKQTKAKVVAITANKEMEKYPYVDLCIIFQHASNVQTHPILFQVITDFITIRYIIRREKIRHVKINNKSQIASKWTCYLFDSA